MSGLTQSPHSRRKTSVNSVHGLIQNSVTGMSVRIVILGILAFYKPIGAIIDIVGPLEFQLVKKLIFGANHVKYLDKTEDGCIEVSAETVPGSYKVGPTNYDSIVVCENGYLFPHVSGDSIPTKWGDGNDFDSPSVNMIAVALINNTRLDNWIDYACPDNIKGGFTSEKICAVFKEASDNYAAPTSVDLYTFRPSYGANAVRADAIKDWIADGDNVISSYALYDDKRTFGQTIIEYIFAQTPGEIFARGAVNNVIARVMLSSEYSKVTAVVTDGFTPNWGTVVSWYKVSQPPEIVDKQNTFQFVLSCQTSPTSRCITLFDYFELMYIENDGIYLRAGINGPTLGKIQLL